MLVAGAGRALPEVLGHGASGVHERAADGFHVRAEDRLAILARPLVRASWSFARSLEARHDVAREQLVALQRLLAVRPFVGAEEHAAEAAIAQPPQVLDAAHHGLHGADERRAHLHALGQRVVRAAGRAAECFLEIRDGLVPLGALDLTQRFFIVLGHVDVDDELPVLPVHRLAVPSRRLLTDLPLVGRASGPPGIPAPSDSTPRPCRPAAITPDGVITLATAIGKWGSVYGVRCSRAWRISNQSVLSVTGSAPSRSSMIASSASSIRGRWVTGSIPIMYASDTSAPGPQPSMARPRVMWSSWTKRWATRKGWWYGRLVTPEPSMMCFVRSAAAAMKISGDAISSQPAEWCSPIQTSS